MLITATNLTKHLQSLQKPVHRPFVAPILCKDLMELGLTKSTAHSWKVINGDAFIFTEHYDPDGYYSAAQDLLDQNYCNMVLPAYQVTDLEPLIGDFTHIAFGGQHEIFPLTYTMLGKTTAPRYCDAVAMLIISGLKKHILKLDKLNTLLTH